MLLCRRRNVRKEDELMSFTEGVVTVVIAAYGRPKALNKTLRSLYRQTYRQWRALIIADCCSPGFEAQLEIDSQMVRVINLPLRCGNQYGPNSVGIHLADTEYLAFLNHDDLWLEDHLEMAVAALSRPSTDFYLGSAAFCHAENQLAFDTPNQRLRVSERNRPEFLWRCLSGPFYFFEPASAWVLRTELAKRIGYWNPPGQVRTMPLTDWLARAALAGARFHIGEAVGVLKINLHHIRKNYAAPIYFQDESYLDILDHFLSLPVEVLRTQIDDDLQSAIANGLLVRDEMFQPIEITESERDKLSGFLFYLTTGIVNTAMTGDPSHMSKSHAIHVLGERTGESFSEFPDPAMVIETLGAGQEP